MRLEFSYLWNEWVEARRVYLGRFRFLLTKYAEASVVPLVSLCVLSLSVVLFSSIFQITVPWMDVALWTVLITLILISLSQIYLSTIKIVNRKVLKQEWEETAKYLRYSLDIEDGGIVFNSITQSSRMGWGQIDWYFHTDNLIFLRKGSAWLAIPKRIFSDEGQLREFMKMLDYRIPLDEQSIS